MIGDSTFTHSGMTPLLDAASENSPITVFIMDNSTVAMTGGQPTFGSGDRLLTIVKGLGVPEDHIVIMEPVPKKHDENVGLIQKELKHEGVSVIIAQRICIEEIKAQKKRERVEV
jgi:indolepyruvate ferredoxin oxidoreductase alpha subunit